MGEVTIVGPLPASHARLVEAADKARALQIRTKADFLAGGQFLVRLRSEEKAIRQDHKAGIDSAKAHLDLLKNEMAKDLAQLVEVIHIVEVKVEAWAAEENRLAKVEEDRRNAERMRLSAIKAENDRAEAERVAVEQRRIRVAQIREALKCKEIGKREAARQLRAAGAEEEAAKADAAAAAEEAKNTPPPAVKVKPDIPVIHGAVRRTNYKWTMKNPKKFLDAVVANPQKMLRYIMANDVAIGNDVREWKSVERAEKEIPGIEVDVEVSI